MLLRSPFSEYLINMDKEFYVYILRCGDGTLYTGSTDNVQKRLQMHRSGKGAKYTRGRGPLKLVYCEQLASRSDALKRENTIKKMTRVQKEHLIEVFTNSES